MRPEGSKCDAHPQHTTTTTAIPPQHACRTPHEGTPIRKWSSIEHRGTLPPHTHRLPANGVTPLPLPQGRQPPEVAGPGGAPCGGHLGPGGGHRRAGVYRGGALRQVHYHPEAHPGQRQVCPPPPVAGARWGPPVGLHLGQRRALSCRTEGWARPASSRQKERRPARRALGRGTYEWARGVYVLHGTRGGRRGRSDFAVACVLCAEVFGAMGRGWNPRG